jgi:tRNA (cytidine56-2'-O)-methyltransferase
MIYTGQRDGKTESSVKKVAKQWGGSFQIRHSDSWKKELTKFNGVKVHLTVYGLPFQEKMAEIQKHAKNLMIIVGGEKVPPEVYQSADYNISVTNQPHSEIAGLALFLHAYFRGNELNKKFPNAKLRVVPQERGKKTLKKK